MAAAVSRWLVAAIHLLAAAVASARGRFTQPQSEDDMSRAVQALKSVLTEAMPVLDGAITELTNQEARVEQKVEAELADVLPLVDVVAGKIEELRGKIPATPAPPQPVEE